jgi:hypothetical protein
MVDFLEYAASSVKLVQKNIYIKEPMHTGGFGGNTFKDIIDKGVEDSHGFIGDTSVRVYLFKDYDPVSANRHV